MARDLVLLANPAAGKGRGARGADAVASRLRAGGFNVDRLVADHAEQAATQAEEAVRSGVGSLVCMGGDGMVHLGLQAVAASETTLGVIATGTGNDLARALDLPRGDPLRAADFILASWARRVDLGEAHETYFATVLATGFDSKVNERANTLRWPHGQMRYNLAAPGIAAHGERVGPLPTTVRVAPNSLRVYTPRSLLS